MNRLPITVARKSENVLHLLRGDVLVAAVTRRPGLPGWRLFPNTSARRASRKAWPTPEEAVASMGYLTKTAAREAIDAARLGKVREGDYCDVEMTLRLGYPVLATFDDGRNKILTSQQEWYR